MGEVAVIGAGLGGLTAACILASRGYEVKVFEANEVTGGKVSLFEDSGYRFDTGPTALTSPSILKKIFSEAGEKLEDHLELTRIDPLWRAFFPDRSVLDLTDNLPKMRENLREFTHVLEDVENYERFLLEAHRLHEIFKNHLYWKPLGGVGDIFDLKALFNLGSLKTLVAARPHQSASECVRSYLRDDRTARIMDQFVQRAGACPYTAPAILCCLAHAETQEGVWYPKGGTRAVPVALTRLAESLGVRIFTQNRITAILQDDKNRVVGVTDQQGKTHPIGAVISNMDSVRTHRELLRGRGLSLFEARREYEPACSGVLFYLGLKKRYNQLSHYNYAFSKDPHEEFRYLYELGEPAPDPTVFLAAPALTDPSVAPEGGEALYVLVHTPYLRPHHNWKEMLPKYRRVVFDKLARAAGLDDIEEHLEVERAFTPQDLHDRYRLLNGSLYGLASHGRVQGVFKPSNRSPDVEGLYFAGSSVHPGPGVPQTMMSGWIAADTLDQDGLVRSVFKAAQIEP